MVSLKKINGTYYVVQAVPDTKAKTLFIVTAYISKKGDSQLTDAKNAPAFTSKDGSVVTPHDNNVSQDELVVNTHSMQNNGNNSQEGRKSIPGTRLSDLVEKYGAIEPGAKPRREVSVPKRTEKNNRVRQFARTAAEATTLSDEVAESAKKCTSPNGLPNGL